MLVIRKTGWNWGPSDWGEFYVVRMSMTWCLSHWWELLGPKKLRYAHKKPEPGKLSPKHIAIKAWPSCRLSRKIWFGPIGPPEIQVTEIARLNETKTHLPSHLLGWGPSVTSFTESGWFRVDLFLFHFYLIEFCKCIEDRNFEMCKVWCMGLPGLVCMMHKPTWNEYITRININLNSPLRDKLRNMWEYLLLNILNIGSKTTPCTHSTLVLILMVKIKPWKRKSYFKSSYIQLNLSCLFRSDQLTDGWIQFPKSFEISWF